VRKKEINMRFIQHKIFQFNELQNELKKLKTEVETINEYEVEPFELIQEGSEAICRYDNDTTVTGKIVRSNKTTYAVKRDGFKGITNFDKPLVKLLSNTRKAELLRRIRIIEESLEKLKNEIIAFSFEFVDFDISPIMSVEIIELKIQILDVKKVSGLDIYLLKFMKKKEKIVKNAFVSSAFVSKAKKGTYILKFMLGRLVGLEKVKNCND
jgi:hypothetical protein